jgi:hypothetical protein
MAGVNFKPNHEGFKALAVSPEVSRVLLEVAEKGKAIAEGLAQPFRESGNYADSFNARLDVTQLKTRFGTHAAAMGVLENTSRHAAAVEWGNKHDSKAHHVISRTAEALET